jgi:hypothetical protein
LTGGGADVTAAAESEVVVAETILRKPGDKQALLAFVALMDSYIRDSASKYVMPARDMVLLTAAFTPL